MENGGAGVDATVGTIVWVRRRNGSWWPGRILGPDELAESHLLSPRSGTPVKLLGREDASVDWYNLEKSKRVKAFRCGEFDACIERAESAQGVPIRKREKYARREDAILHALELERKQSSISVPVPTNQDPTCTGTGTKNGNKSHVEAKKPVVSHRYKSKKSSALAGSWDSLSVPVQEPVQEPCQLAVAPVELQPYQPGVSHAFDTGAVLLHESVPVRGNLMGGSPVYRAKRSHCVYVPYQSEEEKEFAGQLAPAGDVKIESMSMDFLQEPMSLGEGDFEQYGLVGKDEMKCESGSGLGLEIGPSREIEPKLEESETETESESGSSEETDTDTEGRPELLRDTRQTMNQEPAAQFPSKFQGSENYRETSTVPVPVPVPYTDSNAGTSFVPNYDSQEETGVSRWNMKGKRKTLNNRNGTSHKTDGTKKEREFSDELARYNEPFEYNYQNAPVLFDVDLKVQASYQGERVPLVSLMSRLNGKAIVGHPLQIEILKDGSTAGFLPCTSSSTGTDSCPDGTGLPPAWRTGRRSVKQRTARPYRPGLDQSQLWKKKKKKPVQKKSTKSKSKMKAVSSFSGGSTGTGGILGAFMKQGGTVPLVTCVPVKVVFSRILEAVGRPVSHRNRIPGLAVRDPP